jgi:hypothetical protein
VLEKLHEPVSQVSEKTMAIKATNRVSDATTLRELDAYLTEVMAKQQIQTILKDSDLLDSVLAAVERLSDGTDGTESLTALAVLGRLFAVARGKDEEGRIHTLALSLAKKEPPSFEVLADADEKTYAAQVLSWVGEDWVVGYAAKEAVKIDVGEPARRKLLEVVVKGEGSIASALRTCASACSPLDLISNPESRAKRAKRISGALVDILQAQRNQPGDLPGAALSKLASTLLPTAKQSVADDIAFGITDDLLALLVRIIELRFSLALEAATYDVLATCRRSLGRDVWMRFLRHSVQAEQVSVSLHEAALVRARQGRTDADLVSALLVIHGDRATLTRRLGHHFPSTLELDPGIKSWWVSGGVRAAHVDKEIAQPLSVTEDQRIGEALIVIEAIDPSIRYIASTVAPELEFSNPQAAAALTRVASSFKTLAQNFRQLARMRRLRLTEMNGEPIEYNPSQHEMLGGHLDGVRQVKVIRNGIEKQYPNRSAILVKPWVEPAKK